MKSISATIQVPYLFVFENGQMQTTPTFVGSTLLACFLITFIPSLMPVWMYGASSVKNVKE